MFNLELQIKKWRETMASAGIPPGTTLDELECHLRDLFQSSLDSGSSPESAFAAAIARLGQPDEIKREFEADESLEPHANPFSSGRNMLGALSRHRWRITICTALGLAVAIGQFESNPPEFVSNAVLLVRYVVYEAPTKDLAVRSPDSRGTEIMTAEVELLSSVDLAKQVAEKIGAEKIVPTASNGNDVNAAAAYISRHLFVGNPIRSSVIRLSFKGTNPKIIQPILREVVDSYMKMHKEVHGRPYRTDDSALQNIAVIQSPTPPIADRIDARWLFWGTLAGGVFGGIAWAILIELSQSGSNRPPRAPRTSGVSA